MLIHTVKTCQYAIFFFMWQHSGMKRCECSSFVSFSQSGLFMSRWWLQHWTAVEMTWRWSVPPFFTHPLQPWLCPTFWKTPGKCENLALEKLLLRRDGTRGCSWQQHGPVILLNLVAVIPYLSPLWIWQELIVFPLKLILQHRWRNRWLPHCGVIKFSELWSWVKQTLNPAGFWCVQS